MKKSGGIFMNLNFFDLAWPWIGGFVALVLLGLLFFTDVLRSEKSISRWRDLVWLSWAAACAFFLHNLEEYGVDLFGRFHEFPNTFATILHTTSTVGGQPPNAFFTAINISVVWLAGPIAALLSRRHPLVGLSMYGLMFGNALSHMTPFFSSVGYNPGALTAIILFFPLAFWVAYTCFGPGKLSYKAMFVLLATGAIVMIVLLGSANLFLNGKIGSTVVVMIQIANAGMLLLNTWLAEKWLGNRLFSK
jgi:hypothetical protein